MNTPLIRSKPCGHLSDAFTHFNVKEQQVEGDALDSVVTLDTLLRGDCEHVTASALNEFFQSAIATLRDASSDSSINSAIARFGVVTHVLEFSEQAMHQVWTGLHSAASVDRTPPIASVLTGELPQALPRNASPGLTLSLHCGLLALYYGHFDEAVNVRQALRIAVPSPQSIDRAFAFVFQLYLRSRSPSSSTH